MKYNYKEEMMKDARAWLEENIAWEEFRDMNKDEAHEVMFDGMWVDDSVTGNGSGSYTFNRRKAEEYVTQNLPLCVKAMEEFGCTPEEFGRRVYEEDWEYLDVTIRCYLLPDVVWNLLDSYK